MNLFELFYTIGIIGGIVFLCVWAARRSRRRAREVKEGKRKRDFWREF